MSRNEMHNFALNPQVHIERSRFDMDCNIKFTGNAADLIPFYVAEVLPGDTFDVTTSMVCRMQTLIHPIMDNLYLDTYYFFVPNRLVWDHWQNFCGEPDRAWLPSQEYTIPQLRIKRGQGWSDYDFAEKFKGTIIDYMGVGLNLHGIGEFGIDINMLPIRAYSKIYDDWFRDENLIDPENIYTGDNLQEWAYYTPLLGGSLYKAAKLHDYFTSALPQPQRGDPLSLSVGAAAYAPVDAGTGHASSSVNPLIMQTPTGVPYMVSNNVFVNKAGVDQRVFTTKRDDDPWMTPNNLWADLSGLDLGITVNDLRTAFQVQKFMEKSARGGSRYVEFLKAHFGVTSPDARLQRSEYLGGSRKAISIHQVVNQAEAPDAPLGNVGAVSLTSDVDHPFIHSFVEHGYCIGICTIRYKHSYSQGMHRMFRRRTLFDFYLPEFAHLGEQSIHVDELFAQEINASETTTFGFQERWAEYRYLPDRVAGEMRPGIPNSLASWHLGDYYDQMPTLSKGWIQEDIAPVDRALAVTSELADQFLFDIKVNNRATRPMPTYSIPGLVDHF